MKRFLVCFLIFAVCVSSFAAGSKDTAGKGRLFGFTAMDLTNPPLVTLRDSVQKAVEARGDRLISVDGYLDQTRQNNGIEDMITQGIEVLFLNPVDSQSVQPALEACKAAGIKVVVVDSGVARSDLTASFVSSDSIQAGKLSGQAIIDALPNGGKLALIENPLAESIVSRVKGLESALQGSKVTIVERKSISRMEQALPTAEDILQAHPDLDAFWGLNDDVSLIIQGAVESSGAANRVKVFSIDGTPSGKRSVARGGLYAVVAQSDIRMGATAAEVAYKILAGEKVDAAYLIETKLIDRKNIGQFDVDAWE
ncbi:MAG: sugar ABC transporter substrate-binding protein [Treponema sp.]|jgi:ribose transport system substrate-binding protein|nr:sugar ABC transporter substrate-binding protein [Treponema sp.]